MAERKGESDIEHKEKGEIYRVAGPVVTATGIRPRMYDVVYVGGEKLMGEVIKIALDKSVIQVYEDTSGIKPGEPVFDTGQPLLVDLAPGLLGSIYDGIQRPLPSLASAMGDYVKRGLKAPALDEKKKWEFKSAAKKGASVSPGSVLGTVQEAMYVEHRVLVPPGVSGKVKVIDDGKFDVTETIAELEGGRELTMKQRWPVRVSRPVKEKLMPAMPLVTGQRVFDFMFPIAKGGTAAIPGGFGTGKTVSEHQLAKWCDAQIVVYIGCGERGNEMTDVLTDFPKLEDARTGRPLMERTVLIANTSNMPVAAREASVYTGITIAEYFRDMGYHVALMADSTSRWAEAMREISSRLEEMPGEEGFPAYLSARLSEFYERAGRVTSLCGQEGSVSVVGAVSPSGGDFSEPVTQGTLRIVKVFWALDTKLRERRHFPSVNWLTSYSLYADMLDEWFRQNLSPMWPELRKWAGKTLQEEAELEEIVKLVGADALPEDQQLTLETARMIREYFLQQNAFHAVDTFCALDRQVKLMEAIREFDTLGRKVLKLGTPLREVVALKSRENLSRVKFEEKFDEVIGKVTEQMMTEFKKLEVA